MEQNVMIEYIMQQDKISQDHLWTIYKLLDEVLGQNTTKTISYQMPTFKARKNVIHFAAFKSHVGIYPGPQTIMHFQDQLGDYYWSKGTVQIKYNQEINKELIIQMALYSYELNK